MWKSKWKMILLPAFLCVLTAVMADMPQKVSAANKKTAYTAEYARFGITVKGSAYYYKGARIRIFHDMRADHSFVNSFVDKKGTADIRLHRGKSGAIKKLERIPKAEAEEILEDLFGSVPSAKMETAGRSQKQSLRQIKAGTKTKNKKEYTGIKRCELGEVPAAVRAAIKKKCTGSDWYVIKTSRKKYIYYNNLPGDYAFSISGKNLNVRDMGRRTDICVLLSMDSSFQFKLFYNKKPVAFVTADAG